MRGTRPLSSHKEVYDANKGMAVDIGMKDFADEEAVASYGKTQEQQAAMRGHDDDADTAH